MGPLGHVMSSAASGQAGCGAITRANDSGIIALPAPTAPPQPGQTPAVAVIRADTWHIRPKDTGSAQQAPPRFALAGPAAIPLP